MGVAGVLGSCKELRLSSPDGLSTCLRYEVMETMSKQREPARKKRNERGTE